MDADRFKNLFKEGVRQFIEEGENHNGHSIPRRPDPGIPREDIFQVIRRNVDKYFDEKKEEYFDDLERRAEKFVEEQKREFSRVIDEKIDQFEARADRKVTEYEERLDRMLEKEVRVKLKILAYTLFTIVAAGVVSLAYLWIKGIIV